MESKIESIIFSGRWLLTPFYLGLVASIVLLLVKFAQEWWHLSSHIFTLGESDVVIGILALIDMSLVGSLLLMITFSGYEIFVSKIDIANHKDRPDWMGKMNFSGLKLKVIGAIVAISAIDLLKTFVNLPEELSESGANRVMWKVIIHMAFVISGVFFALTDKIASETRPH